MLRIVHINKETTEREADVRRFWEEVLKPKWEAKGKEDAIKFFAKHKIAVREEWLEGIDKHA